MSPLTEAQKKSIRLVVFITVFLDLVGFGIIIPLVGIYGRHFGASPLELGLLGASFSLAQFVFSPFWGALSDRIGRRPVMLISLLGSTLSYLGFALATDVATLTMTRLFAGVFAANISAAQATMADLTRPEERARAMGLIGAAFGLGFTFGPPLGGIAASHWGLSAPGLVAFVICGLNLLAAVFVLRETLPRSRRVRAVQLRSPLERFGFKIFSDNSRLASFMIVFFLVTFAFSNMEQTFSLLFQEKFEISTASAAYSAGLILMVAGFVGAAIQGGGIRFLLTQASESQWLIAGLFIQMIGMAAFPYGNSLNSYYLYVLPLAVGSALINPTLASLLSRSARPEEQGAVFGFQQGAGSLARTLGPFCGLTAFSWSYSLPYQIATLVLLVALVFAWRLRSQGESKPPIHSS